MHVIAKTLKSLVPSANESFICSDLSHQQVALIQLNNSLLKKLQPKGRNRAADKAALDLFLESNDLCSRWEPDPESYHFDTMQRAKQKLRDRFFGGELQAPRVSLANALDKLRPGPGSSIRTKLTDFCGKLFNSKLSTYDKSLWEFYRASISTNWKLAESKRQDLFGECEVVQASRLTYAKKNYDISRVINTEASLDMLFQLGIAEQIEGCLYDWFNIDLSKQPTINRWLAKLGSLDGSFATIDLKSASDMISANFVRWFLPPQMVKPLDSVRAKCIELPDGTILKLHTFSTMGNGSTFALQSLIFSCIVEAAYEELGLPTFNFSQAPAFSVFGDDIVCTKHSYDKVVSLLEWCGFIVNRHKSFNTGSFRESCGADFYKGRDVRGIYVKKLSHETHFYSVFNSLTRWSIRNGVDLARVLCYLKGLVVFRPVPFDASDTAGIKCPFSMSGLVSRAGKVTFQLYKPKPNTRTTKNYERNPDGLHVAALGGFISGWTTTKCIQDSRLWDSVFKPCNGPTGEFTQRVNPDGDPAVKLRRSSTTSWDWIPHKGLTTLDYTISLHSVI